MRWRLREGKIQILMEQEGEMGKERKEFSEERKKTHTHTHIHLYIYSGHSVGITPYHGATK